MPARLPVRPILFVLLAYAALALGYNVVVPAGESPDEPTHLDYVYYLRNEHALPHLSEPGGSGITQGGHPPLYYALAAAITAWSPPHPPRWVSNPHFTFNLERVLAPNAFLHIQEPALPYRGAPELLALHVMRLLSLLGGLLLVAATYLVAATVWPSRPELGWAAAAAAAFVPGLAFFGGVFNNDSLAMGLAALALQGAVRVALGRAGRRDLLFLGAVLGLGMMTKMTSASLAAVAGLAVLVHLWRRRDWYVIVRAAACLGGPVLALDGWWIVRNMRLYGAGDPMGWKAFVRAGPDMVRTLPVSQEISWYWHQQFTSFWGSFGWTTIHMPAGLYTAYKVYVLLALLGLALLGRRWRRLEADTQWGLALLAVAVAVGYVSVFRMFLSFNMVVAHGRYLYPLVAPMAVLAVSGLAEIVPRRWRPPALGGLSAAMLAVSAWCLVGLVRPAFALPRPVDQSVLGQLGPGGEEVDVTFAGRFRLVGYALSGERLTAGQRASIALYWQALPANWQPFPATTAAEIGFVHVLGADGEVIARSDQRPFGGKHPVVAWPPGLVYRQDVPLDVSPDAVTGSGTVLVGWYPEDQPDHRLAVTVDGSTAGDVYRIEHVVVQPSTPVTMGAAVTPAGDSLGQPPVARLAGYRLDGQLAPGAAVTVTLYWRADAPVGADHQVFVHLAGAGDVPLATADGPPQDGRYPMWLWEPGETVPDVHVLQVPEGSALPSGVGLDVGWYDPATGSRVPAWQVDGQPWPDDAIRLAMP